MPKPRMILISILSCLLFIAPVFPDEGMWLFNLPPSGLLQKNYNFSVTPEWLMHIQLSSIRFGGASASFISPDGLVLTNHHVGAGTIQNLSTKERDLMKSGYYAQTKEQELKCPGVELWVLQEIEDVTERVLASEKAGMAPSEVAEAREKTIAALEKENSEATGLKCSVVNLYSGSMYHLYRYKIYTDIRLVFAPEYAAAFFGGDPDNFTYPRYCYDVAFFRVYENDKPLQTPHYLKWATQGVKEGDLVFVSGNPGSTGRLLTCAQLEFLRDVSYPFSIDNLKRRIALLQEYSQKSDEEARIALRTLFGIENSLKATTGYQSGLLDTALMEKKAKEEAGLREAVKKSPEMEQEFGKAWDEVAEVQKKYASLFKPLTFFERAQGFNTTYFTAARHLVRLAAEKKKPNDERLKEYRDSNLPSLTRSLLSPAPIYDEFEIFKLADSLSQLKEEFGDFQEVKWLFGGRPAEEVAEELVKGSSLKNLEVRKKYIEGRLEDIYQSEDQMIKLALLIDPLSRGIRARYEKEVESVETKNGALITRALFKLKGTAIPPDATSTLRLSYGTVKGYVEEGKKIPFQTVYAGLYERAKKFGDVFPYEIPQSFVQKKKALNLSIPLNFVSTADSIGGNSGSPVVNRKGELVGVLFDGNIQSLPTRFVYTDEFARSVMVHSKGIIEALLKVYRANPLVDEILGKKN